MVVVPTAVSTTSVRPAVAVRRADDLGEAVGSRLGHVAAVARRAGPPAGAIAGVAFVAGPGLEFAELRGERSSASSYYHGAAVLLSRTAARAIVGPPDLFAEVRHRPCRVPRHVPLRQPAVLVDPRRRRPAQRVRLRAARTDARHRGAVRLQRGRGQGPCKAASLLGLATALTTLGACSVVAPLTPISDASSVVVMQRLHQALVTGAEPAEALAAATMTRDMADPTAAAFVALGA